MSDHTPGPWAVHPVSAQIDAFGSGTPVPVCRLLWPTELRSEAETEANAHLIAAAPDLLAALNDLWLWASEMRNHTATDPVPDGLGAQVLAALDKAQKP